MTLLRKLSLKHKQMLMIWLSFCLVWVVAFAGLTFHEVLASRAAMRDRLQMLSELVHFGAGGALAANDMALADQVFSAVRSSGDIQAGCLYTASGGVVGRFQHGGVEFTIPPPRPDGLNFEKGHYFLYQRITFKGRVVGTMCLQSSQITSERLREYTRIGLILMGLCSVVTLGLSAWMQRLLAGPILGLARAARSVAKHKDYTLRVSNHSRDEIGELIDDFNEMLGQIQAQDAALHEAHGLLEQRVANRTRELLGEIVEREHAEEKLRRQVERLTLINQLTRAVAERAELASVFHVLLGHLEDRLGIDLGVAYTFVAERQEFVVAAHGPNSGALAAQTGEQVGETVTMSPSFLAAASRGEIFHLVPDTAHAGSLMVKRMIKAGIKSALAVPLQAEGKVLGTLIVARRKDNPFTSPEVDFLRMLGEHVAVAVRQAQLFAELQAAYDDLHATQQIAIQQERLRALGQMASGIAHDINNALTPVMGFTDVLDRTEAGLSDRGRRCLATIKTAAQDIAMTVGRMREFYRQREQGEPLVNFELNKVVQEAIELGRPRWRDIPQQKGIVIDLRAELDPGPTAMLGNESEIRQALLNLVINAVDAMPKGGLLTVRTRQVPAGSQPRLTGLSPALQLEVIDTGAGMDEETRRRCLEPFFTTKGVRGTGLGLAMVYGVVERHAGHIEIDSAPGRGTAMRLFFPVGVPTQESAPAPEDLEQAPPLRVLCIDDEPIVLGVLESLLQQLGHETQTATSGEQGLRLFRGSSRDPHSYDVVITDLGMPGMDGRTFAKQLKSESPSTPVILLTGWGMFLKAEDRTSPNIDLVLSKPPSLSDIQRGLLTVTRNDSARVGH
jgi:signal transduction histidine kinase/ActR/RegA family two-component response regulator/HAMP domain-containing protein